MTQIFENLDSLYKSAQVWEVQKPKIFSKAKKRSERYPDPKLHISWNFQVSRSIFLKWPQTCAEPTYTLQAFGSMQITLNLNLFKNIASIALRLTAMLNLSTKKKPLESLPSSSSLKKLYKHSALLFNQ